jgi:hypothetical protein
MSAVAVQPTQDFLDLASASAFSQYAASTLQNSAWRAKRRLPSYRLRGKLLFNRRDLEALKRPLPNDVEASA